MKKSIVLLVVFLLFVTACAGNGDWHKELPNNYRIARINGERIEIYNHKKIADTGKIDSFIKEYSYDDRYIFTRNVDCILNNDISCEKYYMLDTIENKKYGPYYSINAFKSSMGEKNILLPDKWIITSIEYNDTMTHNVIPTWKYNLPNNYYITNSEYNVMLKNKEDKIVIDSFIKEFVSVENYVITRNVKSLFSNNIFNETYYIFDTEENRMCGIYYSYVDLENGLLGLHIKKPSQWYRVFVNTNSQEYKIEAAEKRD